jgi:N-carbamoylputrescine amidase
MRIALAVPLLTPDSAVNIQTIGAMAAQAANDGACLILFSEAAITGFINTGDPAYDMTLGQSVPGPATILLSRVAQESAIWIGVGLFERDDEHLYDSYLMISPQGTIATNYRRIDPHWHHWHSRLHEPMIYAQGTHITSVALPIGMTTFLLCGDLFNDTGLGQVTQLQPHWLVVPMARGFDSEVFTPQQWYAQDRYYYIERAKAANVNVLLVNQFAHDDPACTYFGGAMAVTHDGVILKDYPLEHEGVLYIDLE